MKNLPGGEMSSRILNFYWVADVSGSMEGEKIQQLNYAIRQVLPDMKKEADQNPNATVMVRSLKFSTGASWVEPTATDVHNFSWTDLSAAGVTDMGTALKMLATEFASFKTDIKALPPVIVMLTDGQPIDDYKAGITELLATPWGKKSIRVGIAIGKDADVTVLEEFTGNSELVLRANNPEQLVKFIKWASTLVKSASMPTVGDNLPVVDTSTIPVATNNDDVW